MAIRVHAVLIIRDLELAKFLLSDLVVSLRDPHEIIKVLVAGGEAWWPVIDDAGPRTGP